MKSAGKNGMRALRRAYFTQRLSWALRQEARALLSPRRARANYREQTKWCNALTRLLWQE